jgi:hypothetical protein
MSREDEIADVVDEIADEANPSLIVSEAERLGLTPDELINRVARELKVRVTP